MKRSIFAALALALAFASAARADWIVTTADFKDSPHLTVKEFSLKDGLTVVDDENKTRKIETREVMVIAADRKLGAPSSPWVLKLRNGDRLWGTPADSDENKIHFTLSEGAEVGVPLKSVAMLSKQDAKAFESDSTRDVACLKNNDLLKGDFIGIKKDELTFHTDARDIKLNVAEGIQSIAFAGITPERKIPPLSARLRLNSGTVLSVGEVTWTGDKVNFKDASGEQCSLTADQVYSLEILGGRTVFLTELDSVKDEQTSYLPVSKWPTQVNLNVLGQPMKMGRQTFSRGLGVHTKSTVAYDLGGLFDTLTLRAGLDDSSAPYGTANLSIVLDGKVIWEKKDVKAGGVPEVLNLPVKTGRKLELHADPADRLDVQGRVNWANLAVTR